jgi:hypothetical protein
MVERNGEFPVYVQLINTPRERPALTVVQFAGDHMQQREGHWAIAQSLPFDPP